MLVSGLVTGIAAVPYFCMRDYDATTWSEVTRYEAMQRGEMGYGVVDFDQILIVGEKKMRFSVIATIIWKQDGDAWKESRYHSSLIGMREDAT